MKELILEQIKIQVFLSTYNGEKYLKEQLDSLLNQKNVQISILVRDDGSQDRTCNILDQYQSLGRLKYYKGNNLGYAKSFLDLVKQNVEADYYAFCDQDDVWLPLKLYEAIQKLRHEYDNQEARPLLYASALQRVDRNLNKLSLQNFKNLRLTLGAEFTRHRLAGCSFVFNNQLRNLLKKSSGIPTSHDKLATILCLACGGKIVYDTNSFILFRRHGDNTSSDSENIKRRIMKDLQKYFGHKNNGDMLARRILDEYGTELDKQSHKFLSKVATYKESIVKTIRLAFSKELGCGFWFFDWFIRCMIFIRCY